MTLVATAADFETFGGLRRSFVHRLCLVCVWLAIASGAIVATEPAPFDILSLGLLVLLAGAGLMTLRPMLGALLCLMMIPGAGALIGVIMARDQSVALIHTGVSIYLYVVTVVFAVFVARRPTAHARLILGASLAGALFASLCGIAGYFDLFPGAADMMTRYSRATGLFKDPNVYGPFLVPGFVYAFHLIVTRPPTRALLPGMALAVISLGLLLSFSRGAWTNAGMALVVYGVLYLLTVRSHRARIKFLGTLLLGALTLGGMLAMALQFDAVANLLSQRAALTQGYDEGPDGRFGGQQKALRLAVERPFGIGAQQFPLFHHHEEAHNVYLSMFMNAGWLGGLGFIVLALSTVVLGLRHAFVPAPSQHLFAVAYASVVGHVCEGFLIDLDHWRHFYMMLAVVWGLMAARRAADAQLR